MDVGAVGLGGRGGRGGKGGKGSEIALATSAGRKGILQKTAAPAVVVAVMKDKDALRDADLRERDEFAERLRQKDLAKTKTLSGREASDMAARLPASPTAVLQRASYLDEQVTLTQAMMFSAFKGPFEQRIDDWNHKLFIVSEVLESWLEVQRNWMYLSPIFESPDINKQLPAEGKKFATVDKNWKQTISATKHNKKIMELLLL